MARQNELLKQCEKYFENNEFKKVIELLTDDVLKKSQSSELYTCRARAHNNLDEYSTGLLYGNLAIQLDPTNGDAYRMRGHSWYNIDINNALSDYAKAIELNPKDSISYFNSGAAYRDLKEYDKAILNYKKAIELDPKDDKAYGNLGQLFLDKGKYDEGIIEVNKAIEINPNNPVSYYILSEGYKSKGDLNQATLSIKKAIQLYPQAFYYSVLGDILFEQEKFPEALNAFEDAVKLGENLPYYESLRDKAKARLGKKASASSNALDSTENTATYIESLLSGIEEDNRKAIRMAWSSVEDVIDRIRKLLIYTGTDPVVHYTRIQVGDIMAMNKEFKLRYSNVVFMNDPEEGDVFLEHLDDREILNSFKHADKKDDNNIYLGSFLPEDKSDYLIMWRTYGKNQQNEEATGCSFLINSDFFGRDGGSLYAEAGRFGPTIKEAKTEDLLHTQPLYKVVYYNREIKQLVNDGHDLTKLTREIGNFKIKLKSLLALKTPASSYVDPKNEIIDDLVYRFVSELRYFFKSAEYQFEKELRVIKYYPMKSTKVHIDTNTAELPRKLYIESTKNLQEYLLRITLGPKVIHPERYMYLEALLKKNGYNNIEVKRSGKNYQ